ncbi:unnamed protein product [Rhodiola kirilowii]
MANTAESGTTPAAVHNTAPAVVTGNDSNIVVDDIYYVNNNKITGNSIVGEILTGRENFVKWKKTMRIALSARLKLGFVEDVTGQILDSSDVANAWNCVHMMYAGSNLSRKFALQQEVANLMQGTMTVAKYFEVLCGLWRELDAMRERRGCSLFDDCVRCQDSARENQENKVMKFLMGLNESLAQIRTHILALEKLPALNVVFDRVPVGNEADCTKAGDLVAKGFAWRHQKNRAFRRYRYIKLSGVVSRGRKTRAPLAVANASKWTNQFKADIGADWILIERPRSDPSSHIGR